MHHRRRHLILHHLVTFLRRNHKEMLMLKDPRQIGI